METLNALELIPTKKELTQLVDSFAETVKQLMDLRNVQTETDEDVRRRHKDDYVPLMDIYFHTHRPVSAAVKFYRKAVLEDGTVIRFQFNPDNPLNDGAIPVKIDIIFPDNKPITIDSLNNVKLHYFGLTNYDEKIDDVMSSSPAPRLHGYQFVAGRDPGNRVFNIMKTPKTSNERREGKPLSETRAGQLVMGIKRAIDVWGDERDAYKNVRDRMFLELRRMLSVVLHTLKIDEFLPEADPKEALRKSLQFRKDDSLSKIRGLFVQACDLCMEKDMADGPEQRKDAVKDEYEKLKEGVLSEEGFTKLICMLRLDDGKHGGRRDIF